MIRNYSTVIKSEGFDTSACLLLNKEGKMEEPEKKERNILRKIVGRQRIFQTRYVRDDYGNLRKMNNCIPTKKILNYTTEIKASTELVEEIRKEMAEVNGQSNRDSCSNKR